MEGMTLCRGSPTSLWRHLLDYLCTSHVLDNCPLHFYPCPPLGVAYVINQLHYGLYTSTGENQHLYVVTYRYHSSPSLLKLEKNLYGLKDGQVTWHEHIKAGLQEHGFDQSSIDPFRFIKGQVILVLYINNTAFFSPNTMAIEQEIKSLQKSFTSQMRAN